MHTLKVMHTLSIAMKKGQGELERESLPTQVEADDEEFNVKLSFYLP